MRMLRHREYYILRYFSLKYKNGPSPREKNYPPTIVKKTRFYILGIRIFSICKKLTGYSRVEQHIPIIR